MIHHNYFSDAFILHDRTNFYPFLERMFLPIRENKKEIDHPVELDIIRTNKVDLLSKKEPIRDERKILQLKWAALFNFYKFQPLNLIRGYIIIIFVSFSI
jgi:hypothetical protein